MRCSKCGTESLSGKRFCAECGSSLPIRCPKCGADSPANARFCADCGTNLVRRDTDTSEAPSTGGQFRFSEFVPSTDVADGERKTVTALFADIKGSMELMENLDPEEARAIVDPALTLMIAAVRRYDGYIVQSTGDGIFALFGAPVAREDHPQRALYAALRLQDSIKSYSAKLVADGSTPIEARVGINTGEVVVRTLKTTEDHAEYTPIGHTANLASRMQAIATSGSIAITDHTRRLVEGYFQFKSRGPTRVKGLAEPIDVYEVTGLGPLRTRLQRAAWRGFSKFVGREREMDSIRHTADLAKQGHGQLVTVIAEPGVGKSRLFYEFKASSQAGWLVLEATSLSHGKSTAYLPVIELLHGYFAIEPNDDMRRRREKVGGKVLMLDRSLEDTLPFLFALLGLGDTEDQTAQMGPQVRRRRMHEAIKRILFKESVDQPLMLIFEDLHWIDGETQSLLNLLTDSLATARILLLVNYRPEYQHQWSSRTYYTQLRLDPLGRENAEEMLSSLLGNEPELASIRHLIIERTEGNPFFIEETIQALLDDGALVRNGHVSLTRPLAQLTIPATVQAILAARIDRLPPPAKELLQIMAVLVLGKELPLKLITQVRGENEEQLDPLLSDLQAGEFIYEQASAAGRAFVFKHSLTEEVAYNSVLAERRRSIHEQAGAAIETLHAAQLEDWYADLAHHYLRTSNGAKAVRYAYLAAEQALNRGAYPEAASTYEQGSSCSKSCPKIKSFGAASFGFGAFKRCWSGPSTARRRWKLIA
jgi:class 3 adenylate cyclase